MKAATERGIVVLNTPGGNAEAAGELAIAMMFALARNLARADATMKAGTWDKKSFNGVELLGKTLGLVGIGNVGSIVGRHALAMGMSVVAYDPFVTPAKAAALGFRLASFDEVVRVADFVSIHSPRTEQTRGLFNARGLCKHEEGGFPHQLRARRHRRGEGPDCSP